MEGLYLEGPMGSGKTARLRVKASRLLSECPASSVLVLCSNHARQAAFIETLLGDAHRPMAQLPVYTYAGFVRNMLFDYWPLAEAELKQGAPCIRPELCGLEDSELILKHLLERLRRQYSRQQRQVFADFPGDESHILKQMVRRLRLRSENRLTREDMRSRSELMGEMWREEVSWLELNFDRESYRLRVLDPNKQTDVFDRLIRMDNALSRKLQREIRHLIVDDVDETTMAQQRLIAWLAPTLETLTLAADPDGGSRRGYLNACPYDWQALKALMPGETVVLERQDAMAEAAKIHLANWYTEGEFHPLPPVVRLNDAFVTRVEMLEQVLEDILGLLEAGAEPGDLALVLPRADFLSIARLQQALQQRGVPVQPVSGTRRPIDNPQCKAFISLIQWANAEAWGIRPSRWEIKTVLMQALRWHHLPPEREAPTHGDSSARADSADTDSQPMDGSDPDVPARFLSDWLRRDDGDPIRLPPPEELPFRLSSLARERYECLAHWLPKAAGMSFDRQLYSAFNDIMAPCASERDAYGDLTRIIDSYLRRRDIHRGLLSGDPAEDATAPDLGSTAEGATGDSPPAGASFERLWLEQVKSGVVADTPDTPEAIRPDAVVIGTPQKLIDLEVRRKYQFWLDVGAREWARSDNAPLYNAWVHSAVWDGSAAAFDESFNEALIRARAGHLCRTLMLLARERIFAYASDLDDLGFSQEGMLKPRLLTEEALQEAGTPERIVLRPDQQPVLAYQAGTMAISAVPGAGKTFVNVALLLELISRGVAPESILVLTYMDSAAKTLLGRLRKKLAGVTHRLPTVCTIHSLALRILTENDHAMLAGLSPDEIRIDEYEQDKILNQVAAATQPASSRGGGDWSKAIQKGVGHIKNHRVDEAELLRYAERYPDRFRIVEFLPALRLYDEEMRRGGLVDFTDLIVKAVNLLERYPDIREKYRRQFTYIIEDEAQDSSRLLQTFIQLLGGDAPNLIRTGDTNQSITTTFSSADTGVFRDFTQNARHRVQMTCSGRCAPEIMALANAWIRGAGRLPGLEAAFQPVDMQPVEGRNPNLIEPLSACCFETDEEEMAWLTAQVRTLREKHPEAAMAVLARTNAQVIRIAGALQQADIPAVSLSNQNLSAQPVFDFILLTLRCLAAPEDVALRDRWHQLALKAHLTDRENTLSGEGGWPDGLFTVSPETEAELKTQWRYDFLDFDRQAAGGNISALIARIAERFCHTPSDRSNGYLCALMAKDILETGPQPAHLSPLEIIMDRFEAFRKSWRGRQGFENTLPHNAGQVVQVMSVHKSKGQEFEVVFLPFLQAEYYPHEASSIRFDEADKLTHELERAAAMQAGHRLPEDFAELRKREKIEEEARLIYVGVTRARQALYLSAHRRYQDRYRKFKTATPAAAFRILAQEMGLPDPTTPTALKESSGATGPDASASGKEARHVGSP